MQIHGQASPLSPFFTFCMRALSLDRRVLLWLSQKGVLFTRLFLRLTIPGRSSTLTFIGVVRSMFA